MSERRELAAFIRAAKDGWLKGDAPRLLLCFSHLRWDFVYQRPQHLMTRAARDHLVIFFEEPVYREGAPVSLELRPQGAGLLVATPVMAPGESEVEAAQRGLLASLLEDIAAAAPGISTTFWYYTPMALGFSDPAAADLCVYDCMDELSAFRGAPVRLVEREHTLLAQADLVFAGGRSLHEAKAAQHPGAHLFASSIDKAHFARARATDASPADQAAIPRPRIGFFGVIDERMDMALLDEVARLRPDWQFVMIGPVAKIDLHDLPQRPNIHWLGPRPYPDLPRHLSGWDLGFMPFARNEATRFISPTKTPEFLAAGLRVVSTPIRDVVRPYGELGLVAIADSAPAFVAAAAGLLAAEKDDWLRRADAFLARTSWDDTWARMRGFMRAAERHRCVPERRAEGGSRGTLRTAGR